jgi:hypothetical protein
MTAEWGDKVGEIRLGKNERVLLRIGWRRSKEGQLKRRGND